MSEGGIFPPGELTLIPAGDGESLPKTIRITSDLAKHIARTLDQWHQQSIREGSARLAALFERTA